VSAADFTFLLKPGQKFRYNAGPYDRERHMPVYTIEVSAPSHVQQLVVITQSFIETADGCLWIWDIENGSDSSLPPFFTVKKDGQPVPRLEHMTHL
jgi:hypothetical protein